MTAPKKPLDQQFELALAECKRARRAFQESKDRKTMSFSETRCDAYARALANRDRILDKLRQTV
jgi:hypothetical protein